jgi:hypothetical protein
MDLKWWKVRSGAIAKSVVEKWNLKSTAVMKVCVLNVGKNSLTKKNLAVFP